MITVKQNFINHEKITGLLTQKSPTQNELHDILHEALNLKGLSIEQIAVLLQVNDHEGITKILEAAHKVKEEIYGKRMVLFAPLYIGNICSNNCLYCGFRKDNKTLQRSVLTMDQIGKEVVSLLKEGHKRVLMLCGESNETPFDYFVESIQKVYSVKYGKHAIRRINVEIAPLSVDEFRELKKQKIGTYACFQETYDQKMYGKYHPEGPKSDYLNRLTVMDRAMEGGIDDVGIGALFGLADYKFEVLALMEHAKHLENKFSCGPHTISVPRIEPADGAEISYSIPHPVSDDDFIKLVAVLRLAVPYTGIILSTRESEKIRNFLFNYGVSQISAGSKTNPGAYSGESKAVGQFYLGDHRSLEEVISALIDSDFIPSFCTGCYRKGRVGNDFMDFAKPGLIKHYCEPNALFSFAEYLHDFASEKTSKKGFDLIGRYVESEHEYTKKSMMQEKLKSIKNGERDLYL